MKYVYLRKSNFVAQLSQLFSQYNMHGVANMIYMTDELTFERVVITFQDDEESPESTVAVPWGTFSVAEKQKKGILLAFRENKAFLYIPFSCLESQDVDSLDSLIDSKFN